MNMKTKKSNQKNKCRGFTLAESTIVSGMVISSMVLVTVNTVEIGKEVETELNEAVGGYQEVLSEVEYNMGRSNHETEDVLNQISKFR